MNALLEAFDLLGPHDIAIQRRPEDKRGHCTIAFLHEADESRLKRIIDFKEFSRKVKGKGNRRFAKENNDPVRKREWFFTRLKKAGGEFKVIFIPLAPDGDTGYARPLERAFVYEAALNEKRGGEKIRFQVASREDSIAARATDVKIDLTALKNLFLNSGYHYEFDETFNAHVFKKLSGMQKPTK